MQHKLYALLPTRQVVSLLQDREQRPVFDDVLGDDCYCCYNQAVEDGLQITRAMKHLDDISVVHVRVPEELYLHLVASGDISESSNFNGRQIMKLKPAACKLINQQAGLSFEVYRVRPTEGPALVSTLRLDTSKLVGGVDFCPYGQTNCACHTDGTCQCSLPQ